jgi:hypothetical protein
MSSLWSWAARVSTAWDVTGAQPARARSALTIVTTARATSSCGEECEGVTGDAGVAVGDVVAAGDEGAAVGVADAGSGSPVSPMVLVADGVDWPVRPVCPA